MQTAHLNLKTGLISIDSAPIALDQSGCLIEFIEKLCCSPIAVSEGRLRYHVIKKINVCGKPANGVIEVGEGRIRSIVFLFDLIEFFESSILESRILKACEKASGINFASDHPTTAASESCQWGNATFYYDPKQGDLSLNITFRAKSNDFVEIHGT